MKTLMKEIKEIKSILQENKWANQHGMVHL